MADRRPESQEMPRAKKSKFGGDLDPGANSYLDNLLEDNTQDTYDRSHSSKYKDKKPNLGGDSDPAKNPYLAHMYEDNTYENGYSTGLSHFKRHQTTALQAHEAED